ncbi:MAG TPA: ATP-binding protein [Acidimicrobiales bacterium]|nr:ATP-binding protein [Acidimicrobiales bacterium]
MKIKTLIGAGVAAGALARLIVHLASLAAVVGSVTALEGALPTAVETAGAATPSGLPSVEGHPVLLGAQLGLMVLFWLAAAGFVYRCGPDAGPLTAALAAGFVLAGFSRLNFSLYPSLYTDVVHTGDLLRLGCYLVLLVGAEREIHRYWTGLAEASVSEERERTARELHDGLVQELSYIRSQTSGLSPERASPAVLQQVALAAERALAESREAVEALGAATEPLASALRRAAEEIAVRAGVGVQVEARGDCDVSPEVLTALSRIVREACSNAVRHGKAQEVVICAEPWKGRFVRVSVGDDGAGFDPQAARDAPGFGLRSMRERAQALGGHVIVDSGPGRGTTVEVVIPSR